MKTRLLRPSTLMVGLVSLVAILAFSQQKPIQPGTFEEAVKKEVLETNAQMIQAGNRLDVEGFFSYILETETSSIIQSGALFKDRQEAMRAVKQGFTGIATMDRRFTNPQVTVVSPDSALLVSEGTTNATLTDGRAVNATFAVSLVYVRKGGQWEVLHSHYSMPARFAR